LSDTTNIQVYEIKKIIQRIERIIFILA